MVSSLLTQDGIERPQLGIPYVELSLLSCEGFSFGIPQDQNTSIRIKHVADIAGII